MKIESIHWDDANIEHIARHGLSPSDIEDLCFGEHIVFKGREKRYILYGQTRAGNMLMIVLQRLHEQVYKPLTARTMTENEKHSYRRQKGG